MEERALRADRSASGHYRTGENGEDVSRFFGAKVAYYSRTRKPEAEAEGVAYLPLPELLQQVDILCTCLPRNTYILGAPEFHLLGNRKILVNTSIGPTFRIPDLQRWLTSHTHNFYLCDGTGMGDVADQLERFDNVLYTKRTSGYSVQSIARLSEKVIANMETFLERTSKE